MPPPPPAIQFNDVGTHGQGSLTSSTRIATTINLDIDQRKNVREAKQRESESVKPDNDHRYPLHRRVVQVVVYGIQLPEQEKGREESAGHLQENLSDVQNGL